MHTTLTTLVRATAFALALPLAAAGTGKPKEKAPVRPINLNTATVTELMQLPHVGARTAERILAFRKQHGGFRRAEEVMNVKGLGAKSFQKLKPYLLMTAAPSAGK